MRLRQVCLPLLMLASACAAAGPAMAACSGTLQFDDDFTKPDRGWGVNSDIFKYGNGAATVASAPNNINWSINANFIFTDASYCVDATPKTFTDANQPYYGIIFWAKDNNSFYTFMVAPAGTYSIQRWVTDRFIVIVPWAANPGIKKAAGETNSLEVDTKGNNASLLLNGTKIDEIRGQPPAGGWSIGILGASEKTAPDPIDFKNLKVANPQ